ncbi:hypothetical protein [Nocardia carnea]|uniref:DUF3558 domain-containing protein n=1 Tax=Nocardia carnea TaxID=37328 RepID=A0ABW7TDZ3_9NOCA|nr:hypothetical protein [Nocardia carnea]
MFRRLTVLCLLLACLTPCTTGTTGRSPAGDAYWLPESATNADRMDLLRRARGVDPCALLPRESLGEYGEVLRVYNPGPSACTAEIASAKAGGRIRLDLEVAVRWAGVPEPEEKPSRVIEGARVTSDGDSVLETDEGRSQDRRCSVAAVFPSLATLAVNTSSPAGTEACPIGEQVMTNALHEWINQPAQGSSPDTVLTLVNDIDPCATATALGVTVSAAEQSMWSCIFTYNGHLVSLHYAYARKLSTPQPPDFGVGPYEVYRSDVIDSERTFFSSTIGPPMETAEIPGQRSANHLPALAGGILAAPR